MIHSILIIDPEKLFCRAITEQFNAILEYRADYACEEKTAMEKLHNHIYDAVLINVSLITSNNSALYIDAKRKNYPLILLYDEVKKEDISNLNRIFEKEIILEKPFRLITLLSHMNDIIRKDNKKIPQYHIGNLIFSEEGRYIENQDGIKTPLTEKETKILKYFFQKKGHIISRKKFLEKIWGYGHDITTHTLETHIYRLRQKIEKNTHLSHIIQTTEQGYKMSIGERE